MSHRAYARAANGVGVVAKDWVKALETLTMRRGLQDLTLLAWESIVSEGMLLRPIRAWCPVCYQIWRDSNQPIYEPLMWAIGVVEICSHHSYPLQTSCHKCNKQSTIISAISRPGYCQNCKVWLGLSQDKPPIKCAQSMEREWVRQSWVCIAIAELIVAAPSLKICLSREMLAEGISYYLNSSTLGITRFAKQLGFQRPTVTRWIKGSTCPQLAQLLKFCQNLNVTPMELITTKVAISNPSIVISKSSNEIEKPLSKVTKRTVRFKFDKADHELNVAINEFPPPSLKEVAKRAECCAITLTNNFRDLCQSVKIRRREYIKGISSDTRCRIQKLLQQALQEDPPPSLLELVRRTEGVSETHIRRMFPDLCKAVSDRYATRPKSRKAQVQQILEKALQEYPPPSMAALAKRCKSNKGKFYISFPLLCHAVAARHADYRSEQALKERETFRQEVRQVALMLVSKGEYPSIMLVSKNLSKPKLLNGNKVAKDALRQLRNELGMA
jgi:hypothetical protein